MSQRQYSEKRVHSFLPSFLPSSLTFFSLLVTRLYFSLPSLHSYVLFFFSYFYYHSITLFYVVAVPQKKKLNIIYDTRDRPPCHHASFIPIASVATQVQGSCYSLSYKGEGVGRKNGQIFGAKASKSTIIKKQWVSILFGEKPLSTNLTVHWQNLRWEAKPEDSINREVSWIQYWSAYLGKFSNDIL